MDLDSAEKSKDLCIHGEEEEHEKFAAAVAEKVIVII